MSSHELRTPLTTISGYAELLENHLVASPEDTEKFLSRIRKEAGRMLTLVEDILRLSQLDEGSLELKPQEVDLKQAGPGDHHLPAAQGGAAGGNPVRNGRMLPR